MKINGGKKHVDYRYHENCSCAARSVRGGGIEGCTHPASDRTDLVLGYKCGHKNVESVKLKARKDVSNIEQAVYRRIQSDGR